MCTLPAACPSESAFSPADPAAWHYSYEHWVEDDAAGDDDGAFSSPGYFDFYPWIDRTKRYYGIVARYSLEPAAYKDPARSGRAIRQAFLGAKTP